MTNIQGNNFNTHRTKCFLLAWKLCDSENSINVHIEFSLKILVSSAKKLYA